MTLVELMAHKDREKWFSTEKNRYGCTTETSVIMIQLCVDFTFQTIIQ